MGKKPFRLRREPILGEFFRNIPDIALLREVQKKIRNNDELTHDDKRIINGTIYAFERYRGLASKSPQAIDHEAFNQLVSVVLGGVVRECIRYNKTDRSVEAVPVDKDLD